LKFWLRKIGRNRILKGDKPGISLRETPGRCGVGSMQLAQAVKNSVLENPKNRGL
jgi:hypothetical protein